MLCIIIIEASIILMVDNSSSIPCFVPVLMVSIVMIIVIVFKPYARNMHNIRFIANMVVAIMI